MRVRLDHLVARLLVLDCLVVRGHAVQFEVDGLYLFDVLAAAHLHLLHADLVEFLVAGPELLFEFFVRHGGTKFGHLGAQVQVLNVEDIVDLADELHSQLAESLVELLAELGLVY